MDLQESVLPGITAKSIGLLSSSLQSVSNQRNQHLKLLAISLQQCHQLAQIQIDAFHSHLTDSLNAKIQQLAKDIHHQIDAIGEREREKIQFIGKQQTKIKQMKYCLEKYQTSIEIDQQTPQYFTYRKHLKHIIDGDIPIMPLTPPSFSLPFISISQAKMISLLSYYACSQLYQFKQEAYHPRWDQLHTEYRMKLAQNPINQQNQHQQSRASPPKGPFASIDQYKEDKTIRKQKKVAKSIREGGNIQKLALLAIQKHKMLAILK